MLISVDELKKFISTSEDDKVLESRIQALESLIRKYTNNNFQSKNFKITSYILNYQISVSNIFSVGDTIEISNSLYNDGLYVIKELTERGIATLDKPLFSENTSVTITKVVYPKDVVIGAINLLKWDLESRDKVGVASESISRHSISYQNLEGNNSTIGYPNSLVGFLKPYIKARF